MVAFLFWLIVFIVFVVMFPIYLIREMKAQKQIRKMQLESCFDNVVDTSIIDDSSEHDMEESITFYEVRIEQLKKLSGMFQAELDKTTDTKRKRTLLARCISLDKQTYEAQQKLNKLRK